MFKPLLLLLFSFPLVFTRLQTLSTTTCTSPPAGAHVVVRQNTTTRRESRDVKMLLGWQCSVDYLSRWLSNPIVADLY
ncbi:hypothetical protein K439DRAFT_1627867 [Ramaria rubella]|nr:hypothetical protein K439DRAFT_1627867 [Ramaria rubella]